MVRADGPNSAIRLAIAVYELTGQATLTLLWIAISVVGISGLALTLTGLALIGYAAISHLGRQKVPWHWNSGVVPIAVRLFVGGLVIQALSFASRIAMGPG
jgi:hypothetical protein